MIGYDHGFGRDRAGGVEILEELGRERGFKVDVVPPVRAHEEPISSSRIRSLLLEGRVAEASAYLGRPYSIRGVVVRGDGRGRELGFPTANLRVSERDKLIPPRGIYAVRAVLRCGTYTGALHLGPRPTFKGSPPTIELHLLDFDRDIYGEEVRVDFAAYLREIEPFTTVAALVEQIKKDVHAARAAVERE